MEVSTRQIRFLMALAEHQNFGRAAKALGVTQPALSQSIKQLEKALGVRLVDRTPKGATLSPFGDVVLRIGHRISGQFDDLRRELMQMQGLSVGNLSVVAGAYAGEMSGHLALASMLGKYPAVRARLKIVEWNRVTEPLVTQEADLALAEVAIAETDARLVAEQVATHPLVFVVRRGHPLERLRRPLTIADITGYPWAAMPVPPRVYCHFPADGLAAGRVDAAAKRFIPAVRVDTVRGAIQIAASSDAVTATTAALVAADLQSGELSSLPFEAPWLRLNYGFIYLRDRSVSPAAKAFMAEVRKVETRYAENPRSNPGSSRRSIPA